MFWYNIDKVPGMGTPLWKIPLSSYTFLFPLAYFGGHYWSQTSYSFGLFELFVSPNEANCIISRKFWIQDQINSRVVDGNSRFPRF